MKQWILGKIFAMFVVFVLTAIGLKGPNSWNAHVAGAFDHCGFFKFHTQLWATSCHDPRGAGGSIHGSTNGPNCSWTLYAGAVPGKQPYHSKNSAAIDQRSSRPLIITSQLIVASFAGIWGMAAGHSIFWL